MDSKRDCRTCVYFLRDPRNNAVRYIGITHVPKIRLSGHWSERLTHYCRPEKLAWLKELDALSLCPVMDIVFKNLSREQAKRVEHFLVKQWHAERPGVLLQGKAVLFDPVDVVRKALARSHVRQILAIQKLVNEELSHAARPI